MSYTIPYASHMREIPSNPIFSLLPYLQKPGFISFAAGVPSPDSFPYSDISRLGEKILKNDSSVLMQYGTTEGYLPLRQSIAVLFERAGIPADPSNIFITTGGQQAIDLIAKLLIEPGDIVLTENPTYSATLQILRSYNAKAVGVASDDDGMIPEDLERKILSHKPKFAYIIPTFQNPTGRTLSLSRRKAIAEITARHGILLIEDDPYRELRYFGEDLPPVKTFDNCGNVIYLTSTSKILCPGLRVGAVLLPDDLFAHAIVAKQGADMHSANLTQALVDAFLREGLLESHLEKIRGIYRASLSAMLSAVKEYMPEEIIHTNPEGGLFIWCRLPDGTDTEILLPQALERNVAFIPGGQFFPDGKTKNCFRINFSNASPEDISRGMEIIGGLFR